MDKNTVSVRKLSLGQYKSTVEEKQVEHIQRLAEKISGCSVVHVNSTSFGGGVAEILHRLVSLMQDVGLDAQWKVIKGTNKFFNATKIIHNALQGMKKPLTEELKNTYLQQNVANASQMELDYDYVVIHDPQPLAIINYHRKRYGKWIWRCHIDLSQPNQEFLKFLTPFIRLYDASIFTMKQFVSSSLELRQVAIIPPSIDPLSDKNKSLPDTLMLSVLNKYDVDPEKPIITQVARFDPWKDPLGVIDVYKLVKKKIPDVQLLLIGSMAPDDPEGWVYFEKTARYAGADYDIHLLTDLVGVHDIEVNAFQRASNVVLQKSLREGFGLTISEALWKGVPVVGANVGGIPLQVIPNVTGFLISSIEEAAEKTIHLLRHPEIAKKIGEKGREHVRKNFLITRHLEDYLKLFIHLSQTD
ncbi:MAG: glycosyltransferase [Candidatus Bathyarchaeota archaeon]|nr:glycosyltransferase [Candidatus Bathyarchaeota archaeon]